MTQDELDAAIAEVIITQEKKVQATRISASSWKIDATGDVVQSVKLVNSAV